jgi:hypothetical protein
VKAAASAAGKRNRETVMTIMSFVKQPVLWLAGLALALAAGNVFAEPPSRCARADCKERHFVYGETLTRRGERWVFLGAYDDAASAAKAAEAAKTSKSSAYYDCRVITGTRLELPPAEEGVLFRLSRVSRKAKGEEGQFRTAQEAAAAAEKILADGDPFEVLYDQFSK